MSVSATSPAGGYPLETCDDGPIPYKSQQDTITLMIMIMIYGSPAKTMVGLALPKGASAEEYTKLAVFRNEETSRFTQATANNRLYHWVEARVKLHGYNAHYENLGIAIAKLRVELAERRKSSVEIASSCCNGTRRRRESHADRLIQRYEEHIADLRSRALSPVADATRVA